MKYDHEKIEMQREFMTWENIADMYGVTSNSVRASHYKWLKRQKANGVFYHEGLPGRQDVPDPAEVGRGTGKTPRPEPYRPPPAYVDGKSLTLQSRPDGTFVFGVAGDKHIASKYHRNDVLCDLYAAFERERVDAIFDTGNFIDGEAGFINQYDLVVPAGFENQVRLMSEIHPKAHYPFGHPRYRSQIPTYAVWGDDHEGWYARKFGIDVGKRTEQTMRDAGFNWTDLGFMESHVKLVHSGSGKSSVLCVMHPGAGSAYALSYRPQKIIESMEGGEKPAAVFMGHYHKQEALNVRNVFALQTACCCDQTPFMRKKSIEAHVGGAIVTIELDPNTGAIIRFKTDFLRYFNRGYYNGRWSLTGAVNQPRRALGGAAK